jgi:hypothetical protein
MPSRRVRIFFLLMVFVVPYPLIYLSGLPHWVGRLIADLIFVSALTVGVFAYSLSSKVNMILQGGKLARPEFAHVRPKVEMGIRILGVAFGLFFTLYITVPFAADLATVVRTKAPVRISTQVRASSGLLVFFRQSVYLQGPYGPRNRSYALLYSLDPMHSGRYEVSVLPRSRMVVDYVELKN